MGRRPAAPPALPNDDNGIGRWQGHDNTFFHKSQVVVGTKLINWGRLYHGEIWEVIEIRSYRKSQRSGQMRTLRIESTERLNDDIVLRNNDRNVTRQASFASLSYSAIWRIAP